MFGSCMVAELPNFGAARGLVLQARGNVFLLVTLDAFGDERFFEAVEQASLAGDETRFDQRRLGLHVAVGDLHAIVDGAHGVADFEAEVPKRIQHAVDHFGEMRQRLGPGHDLAVVQEHEINVAVRIQLGAAVAADAPRAPAAEIPFAPGARALAFAASHR